MSSNAEPGREDGQRYRALFDANPQPMWVVDEQTERFLAVNDAAVAHFGYSREAFLAMTIGQVRAPGEPKGLVGLELASAGPMRVAVRRYLRSDRAEIEAEVWVQVLDWGGRRARLALLRDVTDQRRAERELRESEERLRLLNAELEARVRERTRQLEAARAELQEFIDGMSTMAATMTFSLRRAEAEA